MKRTCLFLIALMGSAEAFAQAWPARPIRVIVPFPPGATMESVVRLLVPDLTKALGQPIIVENKPGAGTVVGVDATAKAAPDGYTFGSVANSFTVNATLVPRLPYDTLKDLQPVGLMAKTANVLVGHPSVQANTLKELVDYAKKYPGKLSYASFGNGTTAHFAGEILKTMAGIDMVHVPYKGTAPALADPSAHRSRRTCPRSPSRATRASIRTRGTGWLRRPACRGKSSSA